MKSTKLKDVYGINKRQIQTTFWQSGDRKSRKLVCTFPGYAYPAEAPITFYQKLYFLDAGFDWIEFDYRYNENESFLSLSDKEQTAYFEEEQMMIGDYIFSRYADRDIVLLGKSMGTHGISVIVNNRDFSLMENSPKIILLTPVDDSFAISRKVEENRLDTLVVMGDRDPFYDEYKRSDLYKNPFVTTRLIDNSGHLLEDMDHDLAKSIGNIYRAIDFVDGFLKK